MGALLLCHGGKQSTQGLDMCQSSGDDPTAGEQLHALRRTMIELVVKMEELGRHIVGCAFFLILNGLRETWMIWEQAHPS